jgi:hypothetical protein
VRVLDEEQLAARDAVYEMSRAQLNEVAQAYVEASRSNATREAALQQLRIRRARSGGSTKR